MLFKFSCPDCGVRIESDASFSGSQAVCPQCGSPVAVPQAVVEPGTTVGGCRLERLLGKGGMGEVYLATQLSIGRPIALKVLPTGLSDNERYIARFFQESRIAGQLNHPGIVTVYDAGEDQGVHYLVMEYVEGESLDRHIKKAGPMSEREVLRVARSVSEALGHAWEQHGILHRDVKPANIMFDRRGAIRVMDLGLAKATSGEPGLTRSGQVLGSPRYMSPEQARSSATVDVRADIYSLGATLYNLLTDTYPVSGTSAVEVIANLMEEPLLDIRERNPAVSEGCARLVTTLMAKDRRERPPDWGQVVSLVDAAVLSAALPDLPPPASSDAERPKQDAADPEPEPELEARADATANEADSAVVSNSPRPDAESSAAPRLIGGILVSVVAAAGILLAIHLLGPRDRRESPARAPDGPSVSELNSAETASVTLEGTRSTTVVPPKEDGHDGEPQGWERRAHESIEAIRKATFRVIVRNRRGQPIPGVAVRASMKRHAFRFGTSVDDRFLLRSFQETDPEEPDYADLRRYRETLVTYFNEATSENALKWSLGDSPETLSPEDSVRVARWLRDQRMSIRGHSVIWPSFEHMPKHLSGLRPRRLRIELSQRVIDVCSGAAAVVDEWDVVNEPGSAHDILDKLGLDDAASWFRLARKSDPDARLFVNEFGLLRTPNRPRGRQAQARFRTFIEAMRQNGAPLDGIGVQAHFRPTNIPSPGAMTAKLDDLATLGYELKITQLDILPSDPDDSTALREQAESLRRVLTVAFGHPAVTGVVLWGFWEGRHWRPDAALWAKDWSIRPIGQEYLDLVHGEWWSDLSGKTDPNGTVELRGFRGDYDVAVSNGGLTKTVRASITQEYARVDVTLR